MPLYEFENLKGERTTFFYPVSNYPKIGQIHLDENKIEWKRVFSVPNASSDTNIDPYSQNDFIEKTGKKKGTLGDLYDQSRELSEKRAKDNGGEDPVKKKKLEDYKKKRFGVEHFEARKKKIEKKDVSISLD